MSNVDTGQELTAQQEAFFQRKEETTQIFNQLLDIPANQLGISIMITQTILNALVEKRQEVERRYQRPVLVRTYFPGSVKATVGDAGDDGVLTVTLELLSQNADQQPVWTPLDSAPSMQKVLKDMVLSQTALPGDVWFITTNAAVEANMAEAAKFFEQEMDRQDAVNQLAVDEPVEVEEVQELDSNTKQSVQADEPH